MAGGKAPRAAGDRFERACIVRLRTAGYYAIRSAGSHGMADLIALRADRMPSFIQCKITDNTTVRERLAFYRAAEDAGAIAILVSRHTPRGALWVRVNPEGVRVPWTIQ
jgi:Holliday junction resolvase